MRRGTRVGQAYIAITADGDGVNEEIVSSVDEAGADIDKKGSEQGDSYGEHFSEGFLVRMRELVRKRFTPEVSGGLHRAGKHSGDSFARGLAKSIMSGGSLNQSVDRFSDYTGSRLAESVGKAIETRLRNIDAPDLSSSVSGNSGRDRNRTIDIGGRVGSLLGAGSRNNALNLLGKSLGNTVRIVERLRGSGAKMFSAFRLGFTQAAEGASVFQRAMAGGSAVFGQAGKGLTSLAASGPAVAIAIGVLIVSFSILSSILSALVGTIAAFSATIVSGLVGALAVAGGGILALVAAGGLLTIMVTSLNAAQKKLASEAFAPLGKRLTSLGQTMASPIFKGQNSPIERWAVNLRKALDLLTPVAKVMGDAFASAGSTLTRSFSGPGFQRLADSLGVNLPGIIERLSRAFGRFLNGTTGLFAAILPDVNDFAKYLSDLAGRFSRWANSVKGQNQIKDFVDRALVSLKSLSGFIKQVGGLLSDVLFSKPGQRAGNDLFDSLADAVKKFRRSISNGDLERWFQEAQDFAKSLGRTIRSLAGAFEAFRSSGVLKAITKSLDGLNRVFEVLRFTIKPMIHFLDTTLPSAVRAATAPFQTLIDAVRSLKDAIDSIDVGAALDKLNPLNLSKLNPLNFGNPLSGLGRKALGKTGKGDGEKSSSLLSSLSDRKGGGKSGGGDGPSKTMLAILAALGSASRSPDIASERNVLKSLAAFIRNQKSIDVKRRGKATAILDVQAKYDPARVDSLLKGVKAQNATLADYAVARSRIAAKLEAANQKLTDAITLRDDYRTSVIEAIQSFGDLTTAQGQTFNGIEQAVTAVDIVSNLRTRLAAVQKFQSDLKTLLASGLSDAAYKQLVDAGVEGGGAYASALVEGGASAISDVNNLTKQINATATQLGTTASTQLYQAGVDAARGLVAGLVSMSAQLDAAATKLGHSIAKAIKKALGIKSPSRVMIAAMGSVGDGLVTGLEAQHNRVENAAVGLSRKIAVSPEVAAHAARQGQSPEVSGNGAQHTWVIQTPTEDPEAVAHEVLNEVTGRL